MTFRLGARALSTLLLMLGVAGGASPVGAQVPAGPTGATGPFPGTLPSGATVKGSFSLQTTAANGGEFARSSSAAAPLVALSTT